MKLRRLFALAAAVLLVALPIRADEVANQWVAKARSGVPAIRN